MNFASLRRAFAATFAVLLTTSAAQAVPIASLPGLNSIVFWERSGGIAPVAKNFLAGDARLTTRLADPLSTTNNDFTGFGPLEQYDVFYSDADGTLNANGAFVSIEAIFNAADSALNIARVDLVFSAAPVEFASSVASFVAGPLVVAGSELNAIDGDLSTHSFLGNTATGGPTRLRLTLGFESTAVAPIPIPATLPLLLAGLGGLFGLSRWRRKMA